MIAEIHSPVITKRSLKKLRAQFLHKKEDEDEEKQVDTATKYLSCNNMFMLQTSLGLVEIDRKIGVGPHNSFKIINSIIETKANRILHLNLEEKRDPSVIPSWEYSTERLESYGDLELATLAHRIKKFYRNLNTVVSHHEQAMRTNDDDFTKIWDKTITKAKKACEELDKNEIFYKVIFHFRKDSVKTISTVYSEGFLRVIGFKLESFVKWTEKNGMRTIFDPQCAVFGHAVKQFFDFTLFQGNCDSIIKSEEYETYLYDYTGSKIKMLVTGHYVLEPVADGFLSHDYFIVKDIEPSSSTNKTTYQ